MRSDRGVVGSARGSVVVSLHFDVGFDCNYRKKNLALRRRTIHQDLWNQFISKIEMTLAVGTNLFTKLTIICTKLRELLDVMNVTQPNETA